VLRRQGEVARRADHLAGAQYDVRDTDARAHVVERSLDPFVGVARNHELPGTLVGGGLPQPLGVPLLERLERDDPPLQPFRDSLPHGLHLLLNGLLAAS
jgi:hypothetical protein